MGDGRWETGGSAGYVIARKRSDRSNLTRFTRRKALREPAPRPARGLAVTETGGPRVRYDLRHRLPRLRRARDQPRYRSRLGDVDRVAANGLHDGRSGALGHEALSRRRDHPVLGGHEVPARLRLPGRLADGPRSGLEAPRNLGIRHERGLLRIDIAGKRRGELGPVQEEEAVLGWQDRGNRRTRYRILDQAGDRLARVRRKSGDIDQRFDLGIIAGFGDHGTAVGVADQDHRAVLRRDDPPGDFDIAGQRERGVLHDADLEPVLLEGPVNPFPTRAVHEAAVDQHDVADVGVRGGGHWRLLSTVLQKSESFD